MPRTGKRRPTRQIHNDANDPAMEQCWRLGCGHQREKHGARGCAGLNYDPLASSVPCVCTGFVEKPARK